MGMKRRFIGEEVLENPRVEFHGLSGPKRTLPRKAGNYKFTS